MLLSFSNMDINILLFIQNHIRMAAMTPVWHMITLFGEMGIFWIAIGIFLSMRKETRTTGFMVLLAIAIDIFLANGILKHLAGRARPFAMHPDLIPLIPRPSDFSFPSGHTAVSFAASIVLLFRTRPRYGVPAVILAFLIAFSRLYLGVHYPTDVLGGMVTGTVSAFLAPTVYRKIKHVINSDKYRMRDAKD